jgi:putative cell wall-binding protein
VFTAAIAVVAGGLFTVSPALATTSPTSTQSAGSSPLAPGRTGDAFGHLGHEVRSPVTADSARALVAQTPLGAAQPTAGAAAAAVASSPTLYANDGTVPYLVPAGGRVWFIQKSSTDHFELHRIESDGVTSTFALPDDLYEPAIFSGPDGGLWVWSPTSDATDAPAELSRVAADGTVTVVESNLTGTFYGGTSAAGWLWLIHGTSALAVAADGSVKDYAGLFSATYEPTAAAVSTNGNLWLVDYSGLLLAIHADGTTSGPAFARTALDGGDIDGIEATGDGSAWVTSQSGGLAVVHPDLTSTKVVAAKAGAGWPHIAYAVAVGADPASVWFTRTADSTGETTEVIHVDEQGVRDVDVTDPYDFSPLFDGAVDGTTFVDSSNRLWLGEFSWSGDGRMHMASYQNGKFTRYAAPEGYEYFFDGFHESTDGHVWAYLSGIDSMTSGNVDVFDPATASTVQYPVKTGLFPVQLTFDDAQKPWVAYVQSRLDAQGLPTLLASFWGSAPTTAVQRTAGADRYATSVAFSKQSFPNGAPVVYLASGENFPDGLSAGPAAGALGGPVLLTPKNSVPTNVRNEIARLKPSKIVIVGGTASVSAADASRLAGLAPSIVRVAGNDRYLTSAAVVRSAFPKGAKTVYLANGNTFPDALSGAGAAGAEHAPVLLVNGAASSLNASTVTLLKQLGATSIKILGGTASVSTGVANAAAKIAHVTRLSGVNRYATSAAVAESMTGTDAWKTAYLVSGENFADALSVGAVAAAGGHPIVLSQFGGLTRQVSNDLSARGTTQVDVLGGYSSLSWAVGGLQVINTTLVPVD